MNPVRLILWTMTAAAAFGLSWWSDQAATFPAGALATVNGTTLSEADLQLRLRPDHQQQQPQAVQVQQADFRKSVLEAMVVEELAAQRAHELGLDSDPEYLAGLRPLQAQVDAYKRKALGELLAQHEATARGEVSETEAKQFYEANAARLKTQVQVWQILRRSEEEILQVQRELAQASSFEAYARTQFPELPPTERPWDLGYLRWEQLPEPWHDVVYSMKKGGISPVIRGAKDRYWILQLADVRETDVTFESVRPTLVAALKGKKLAQLQERLVDELRVKAKVVYVPPR